MSQRVPAGAKISIAGKLEPDLWVSLRGERSTTLDLGSQLLRTVGGGVVASETGAAANFV